MQIYYFFVMLMLLSAALSYINVRYLKLPFTIGLMVLGIVFSLSIILLRQFIPQFYHYTDHMMSQIDFSTLILDVMLSFMLFAGALHTDSSLLKQERQSVAVLSVLGVLFSTTIIGGILFLLFRVVGIPVSFIYCLLFGALISPTDPIAVLSILTKANAPKKIETNIVGESLFNDGVGVVIFITILQMIRSGDNSFNLGKTFLLFFRESGGGIVFGWLLGKALVWLLKQIDHFQTEVLISLAMVMSGYLLCQKMHISGPLAIVLAGLVVGDRANAEAMSETTELYLYKFWELVDVLLNAVLFVLIGLRIMLLEIAPNFWLAAAIALPTVLLARWLSVKMALYISRAGRQFDRKARTMLVWGGLRGGLSIALALSLQQTAQKDLLVFMTYAVVLFSILIQGLSIGRLTRKFYQP